MRMCVIGAGAQGSVIAKILADDPEIDKVVLADINTQLLQRVAKKIDSSKLTTERVDAGNSDDLAKVMKGADVAVNATLTNYNLPNIGIRFTRMAAKIQHHERVGSHSRSSDRKNACDRRNRG